MDDKNKYSIIVDTLQRMYSVKEVSISQVKSLYNKGVISLYEYNYILGKK